MNWFSQFIPSLARFTGKLEKLRSIRDVKTFKEAWLPAHTEQFNTSKRILLGLPALHPFSEDLPTYTASDASSYGVSAILWQLDGDRVRLVSLASRPLTGPETKYSIPKLEVLALIFTLRRFRRFVIGINWTHYTDHQALVWLHMPRPPARILVGWMDEILELEGLRIAHASGVANKLADLLSRIYGSSDGTMASEPPNPPKGGTPVQLIPDPKKVVVPEFDESAQDGLIYRLLGMKVPPHANDVDATALRTPQASPTVKPPALLTYRTVQLPAADRPFDLTPLDKYDYAATDTGANTHPPGDQHVRTPPALIGIFEGIFGSLHDVTPHHADLHGIDSLAEDFLYSRTRVNYANPPYSNITPFVAKAVVQSTMGCTTVLLLPDRPTTKWYQVISAVAQRYLFPQRIPFVGYGGGKANFDSILFIVRPTAGRKLPDLRDIGLFQDCHPETCQIVTDPATQLQLLEDAHALGHFGAAYLVNLVRYQLRKNWPGITNQAKDVVATCVSCLRFNIARRGFHPLTASSASLPWDSIAFDAMHVGIPSTRGHNYILIIVDVCTRMCFLIALVGTTTEETAKAIFDLCCILGFPKQLQHDGGPENSGPVIKELARLANAAMRFTTPYNPAANGLPERFTRTARACVNKFDLDTFRDWDLKLKPLQLTINIGLDKTVGSQKFALFYARRHNPFDDFRDTPSAPMSPQELQDRLHTMQEVVYPTLSKRAAKAAKSMEGAFNKKHRLIAFAPGDHVMTRDPRDVKPKHESEYDGPFLVTSKNDDGTYTLRDHDGTTLKRNFAPQQLKRAAVKKKADAPEPSYVVTKILDHRTNAVDGSTEYLVHWKGYSSAEDSWILTSQFDDDTHIKRYIKANAPRGPHDKRPVTAKDDPLIGEQPAPPRRRPKRGRAAKPAGIATTPSTAADLDHSSPAVEHQSGRGPSTAPATAEHESGRGPSTAPQAPLPTPDPIRRSMRVRFKKGTEHSSVFKGVTEAGHGSPRRVAK